MAIKQRLITNTIKKKKIPFPRSPSRRLKNPHVLLAHFLVTEEQEAIKVQYLGIIYLCYISLKTLQRVQNYAVLFFLVLYQMAGPLMSPATLLVFLFLLSCHFLLKSQQKINLSLFNYLKGFISLRLAGRSSIGIIRVKLAALLDKGPKKQIIIG